MYSVLMYILSQEIYSQTGQILFSTYYWQTLKQIEFIFHS